METITEKPKQKRSEDLILTSYTSDNKKMRRRKI